MFQREILTIELTTFGPLFIGDGEKLSPSQYIHQPNGKIIIINESKLMETIIAAGKLDAYIAIMKNRKKLKLHGILKTLGIGPSTYSQLTDYEFDASSFDEESINDIALFAKTLGKPYVPGSTVKGALRTALAAAIIQENPKLKAVLWQKAKEGFGKRNFNTPVRDMEKHLFYQNAEMFNHSKAPNMLHDCLRGLIVSDSQALGIENLCLVQKVDLSTYKGKNDYFSEIPLYRESLKPGVIVKLMVTLDYKLLKNLGITDSNSFWKQIDKGLEVQRNIGSDAFKEAMEGFRMEEPEGGRIMAVGGGTGFQSKTVVYPLAPDFKNGLETVRNMMESKFKNHKHQLLDKKISPRTMKLTDFGGKTYPMGLCSIREVVSCQ